MKFIGKFPTDGLCLAIERVVSPKRNWVILSDKTILLRPCTVASLDGRKSSGHIGAFNVAPITPESQLQLS